MLQKQQQSSRFQEKVMKKLNVSYSFTIFCILVRKYISATTIIATYHPRCALVSTGNNFARSNPITTKSIFATAQSNIVKWCVTFLIKRVSESMGMGRVGK